jgi:CheY-like chemotaxis protein
VKKLGFKVDAAWNGKEALDYLEASQAGKHTKPDIILMDVQMPVIDGYKCTHILRHHVPYRAYTHEVPIIAMTASAIQGDREKCKKAGMDDYLAKPVKSNILEKMLVRWGNSRRAPQSFISSDYAASNCSETGEHCVSADIPTFGLTNTDVNTKAPSKLAPREGVVRMDSDLTSDDHFDEQTPRPIERNGSHDVATFPFGSFSSTTTTQTIQLDSNERAMQLRNEKLLGASGKQNGLSNALPEGDSLTEENVERHEKEESLARTNKQ